MGAPDAQTERLQRGGELGGPSEQLQRDSCQKLLVPGVEGDQGEDVVEDEPKDIAMASIAQPAMADQDVVGELGDLAEERLVGEEGLQEELQYDPTAVAVIA